MAMTPSGLVSCSIMPARTRKSRRKPVTCQRCGRSWIPYGRRLPQRCANPTCRSPYWRTPKVRASTPRPPRDAPTPPPSPPLSADFRQVCAAYGIADPRELARRGQLSPRYALMLWKGERLIGRAKAQQLERTAGIPAAALMAAAPPSPSSPPRPSSPTPTSAPPRRATPDPAAAPARRRRAGASTKRPADPDGDGPPGPR